jgi:hypothetical protein
MLWPPSFDSVGQRTGHREPRTHRRVDRRAVLDAAEGDDDSSGVKAAKSMRARFQRATDGLRDAAPGTNALILMVG